jgi:hypothetical protein
MALAKCTLCHIYSARNRSPPLASAEHSLGSDAIGSDAIALGSDAIAVQVLTIIMKGFRGGSVDLFCPPGLLVQGFSGARQPPLTRLVTALLVCFSWRRTASCSLSCRKRSAEALAEQHGRRLRGRGLLPRALPQLQLPADRHRQWTACPCRLPPRGCGLASLPSRPCSRRRWGRRWSAAASRSGHSGWPRRGHRRGAIPHSAP